MAQHRQVLAAVADTHPALILAEGDSEDPMGPVLAPPHWLRTGCPNAVASPDPLSNYDAVPRGGARGGCIWIAAAFPPVARNGPLV